MSSESTEELTSAEAGFFYAARVNSNNELDYDVDELSAGPLARLLRASGSDDEVCLAGLEAGRFSRWWDRRSPKMEGSHRDGVGRALQVLQGEKTATDLKAWIARRRLQREISRAGGDLSAMSVRSFDLRRWRDDPLIGSLSLSTQLTVVGLLLAGAMEGTTLHRKVAASLRTLPPAVRSRVRSRVVDSPTMPREALRRVYEVYRRIADRRLSPEKEFALLGLFFLITASIFRQNPVIDAFAEGLEPWLRTSVPEFRRACVTSGKPQLGPLFAQILHDIRCEFSESCSADEKVRACASKEGKS